MILEQIAPEIAAQYDLENVVLISTPGCTKCYMTSKLLASKGVKSIIHEIDDRNHPVLVAIRAHLGLDTEALVPLPAVFVKGRFRWNDLNGLEISTLAEELAVAA